MVRTDMHSDNSGCFQIVANLGLFEPFRKTTRLAEQNRYLEHFLECLTYKTCTESYVSHVDPIINILCQLVNCNRIPRRGPQ